MRDYLLATPSLDGVLHHESIVYEGINRPEEILRILDGPATKGRAKESSGGTSTVRTFSENERRVIEQYFYDLHSIFMKKLSLFILGQETGSDNTLKLQAMLQEMIKIRKLMQK